MTRANDPRLEHLLANIRTREALVRGQLANVGGNLCDVILTELEAGHRTLIAALGAGDAIGAANAAFTVDAVIHRANMAVLSPKLWEAANAKRARHKGSGKTNEKKQERNAPRNARMKQLVDAGTPVKRVAHLVGLSVASVHRIVSVASE